MRAYITEVLVPMRAEANHQSEMVNELLFGEMVDVNHCCDGWVLAECVEYDYHGYIPFDTFKLLDAELLDNETYILDSFIGKIRLSDDREINIVKGSRWYNFMGIQLVDGSYRMIKKNNEFGSVISDARAYLNAPYRWGGRSPFGIDCSGFVQIVFALNGHKLPRDASQQALEGEPNHFLQEAFPGDLAFFGEENEPITHVGIMLNNHNIIHASGKVRIDKIDHFGIMNVDSKKYTHKLRFVKSILG